MQDTPDRLDMASGEPDASAQDEVSRRELLERIERFAYVAPALALLVAPTAAAGYGGKGGGGKGGGKGGKGKGGGKGGRGKGGRGRI